MPLADVHDHRVPYLRERTDARLDLPRLRIHVFPRVAGQQRHAIPHRQLPHQRLAVDVAKRRADVPETGAVLVLHAQQHIKPSACKIGVDQNAFASAFRQLAGQQSRQGAGSDSGEGGIYRHDIAQRGRRYGCPVRFGRSRTHVSHSRHRTAGASPTGHVGPLRDCTVRGGGRRVEPLGRYRPASGSRPHVMAIGIVMGTVGTCDTNVPSAIRRQRHRRNLRKGNCVAHTAIEKRTRHRMQAERPLWSENAGYPHPRRVIHSRPQHAVTQNSVKAKCKKQKERRTKKEDPPKRAFLQESSEQNRCTTTSS